MKERVEVFVAPLAHDNLDDDDDDDGDNDVGNDNADNDNNDIVQRCGNLSSYN